MKLTVIQRTIIVSTIPEKGNFETLSTVENLRKILYLSEEEIKYYGVVQTEDQLTVKKNAQKAKEIEISEMGMNLIMKSFKKLDDNEELSFQQYEVYKYLKEEKEKKTK